MRTCVVVVAGIAAMACNPVKSDFDNLCHAAARSGSMGTSAEDQANAMRWADRAMRTQEARGVIGRLATMSPSDKSVFLRAEAAKVGVSPCPLADSWAPPN
jgi:hypothetical protein